VIEAYFAACSAALEADAEPLGRRAFEKRVSEQFERGELLGDLVRPEGRNPVTFQNALEMLARDGILERGEARRGRDRRREPTYARGPAFETLPALRDRLAAALLAR